MTARFSSFVALIALMFAGPSVAQDALLAPSDFLGYDLGDRFTPHHRVVDYVEHVAARSPRVQVQPYGTTYEGRPLLAATITKPERLDRIETIRTNHLKRLGLLDSASSSDDAPAIVWLSYNIHGNESVSTEAALQVLYRFANPDDAQTQAWLEDVVLILDPCLNPDGRDRYVHGYQQTVGMQPDADIDAREHHEPWPGGRTNHYYFDLNRDWAWAVQQETQQRLALYNQWLPHIHVDLHEQGVNEPYYFAPAAEPYHPRITDWQRTFQATIGENNARTFDAQGWLYFTREVFDLFYPGYGDTWPTFNGAIGMTYEQGGSGRAGRAVVTAEGDTLTLRDRIDHHVAASLSTVEATAENYEAVTDNFVQYYEQARTDPQGPYRAYVVKTGNDPDQVEALTALLDRQDIAYGTVTNRRTVEGRSYEDASSTRVTIAPGDLVVSAAQPKGVLANVLFEPEPELVDSLTYDITAWALPYAYGVEAYALTEALTPDAPWQPPSSAGVTGPDRPYAYLARWNDLADARFLADALQAGLKPRYALESFETDGRPFVAGTLIFTRTGHERLGDRFDAMVRDLAAAHDQPLHGVASGLVRSGMDFGSDNVPFLKAPRVAVLAGEPLSSYSVGEVWHFFEHQLGYPATLIHPDDLGQVALHDYDVLVLPRGRYGEVLTEDRLDDVLAWMRDGGRLIALETAVSFLAGKDGLGLTRKAEGGSQEGQSAPAEARLRVFGDRERAVLKERVSGAVFPVTMDPTHPLAFGYGDTYYSLKRRTTALAFLEDGWNVGVLRDGTPVSGFAGVEAQRQIANTLTFGVEAVGRGEAIYFVDNPLYRGFWEGGKLLIANAVFLVGQRTPSTY